jgi:hypothetical protein
VPLDRVALVTSRPVLLSAREARMVASRLIRAAGKIGKKARP